MKESTSTPVVAQSTEIWAKWQSMPRPTRLRIASCAGWMAGLTVAYVQPLTDLIRRSMQSELNSYIPLVPFVSAYVFYLQRHELPSRYRSSIVGTVVLCVVGLALFVAATTLNATLSPNDRLSLITFSYVVLVSAGGFLFLGSEWMAGAALPAAFLMFLVPLPDAAVHWIESASVLASADVAAWFFRMTGTPLLRDGTVLTLPGIVLQVAHECSGIHSSWILFITSIIASHLFLANPWRRLILVAFVFPLAIARNGFRILVIGLLCVHINPEMINSFIHRQGGPIFFALSLVPLFGLLFWLRRQERRPT